MYWILIGLRAISLGSHSTTVGQIARCDTSENISSVEPRLLFHFVLLTIPPNPTRTLPGWTAFPSARHRRTRMRYAINQGVRIHDAVEGDRPPVLLQHGMTGTVDDWRHLADVDALKTDFQLILPDAQGHGASDKPHQPAAYLRQMLRPSRLCLLTRCRRSRQGVPPHEGVCSAPAKRDLVLSARTQPRE